MSERLDHQFYLRPTLEVAQDLLGKKLVTGGKEGMIVETEAYIGPADKASHAYQGKKTERNQVVFEPGGLVYIYLCYGIHWQLNITTDQEKPECVLIRALEPDEQANTDGPGKLTKWMGLDQEFYGEDLVESERLWLEKGEPACRQAGQIKKDQIVSDQRVGIDYAEEWTEKEWRFYLEGNDYVSTG